MRHIFRPYILPSLVMLVLAAGCIKNDIPYPRIQPNIIELTVENQSQKANLDSANRMATVYLNEEADIYAVKVLSCGITPGASFVGDKIEGVLDLSSPRDFTMEIYQEYVWTLTASQQIERYFTVRNQMGASTIDVPGHRVVVSIPSTADISAVEVLTAKLGPVNSVMTPNLAGQTIDLSVPVEVEVTSFGRTEKWTVYGIVTEATVTTVRVDAWTNVAWVYGEAQEGKNNTVEYRRADSQEWIRVPDSWLTTTGGAFHARLTHLESLTDYVARAVSDDENGLEIAFTTGAVIQPENADFENWWLDGKVWCPWAEDGQRYWDTGNKGATTLGQSNSVPTDDTPTGQGHAAKLETRFVGIASIGKLASGNMFAGKYVKTDGTNGILSFGREYSERPTKLMGYFKYHSAPISSTTKGFENLKGRPDTCIVWAALIDSDEPFEIRTNPNNRQLFNPDGPEVIAYGNMQCGYDIVDYQQFEFDFVYKSTSRVPKYLLIVASASKYGDYFTGGNGSILYIDDLELKFDY